MTISLTGASFVLDGILLTIFSLNRFDAYRLDRGNYITRQYFVASFFVSLAMFFYGLPVLFTSDSAIVSICGVLGLISNAIGFSQFFLIALYSWLPSKFVIIAKTGLLLYVAMLATLVICAPPTSYVDVLGIVHWRFGDLTGLLAAFHMDIAFISNISLLMLHFYRLKKLSAINTIALIITFSLTGISGTYQYIGNATYGLMAASIGLCLGVIVVFLSVIRGTMSHILEWQAGRST